MDDEWLIDHITIRMKSNYFSLKRDGCKYVTVTNYELRRIIFFCLRFKIHGKIKRKVHQVSESVMLSYEKHKRPPRPKISVQTRWELSAKQKFKCMKCKQVLPVTAEIDHIIPRHKGGSDRLCNLQALCNNCHALKTRNERTQPRVHHFFRK